MSQPQEYEVEQILDERVVKGKKEYKIQWHGYSEDYATWEKEQNITSGLDELVAEFLARKSGDGAQIRSRRRSTVKTQTNRRAIHSKGSINQAAPKTPEPKKRAVATPEPKKTPEPKAEAAPKSAKKEKAPATPRTPRAKAAASAVTPTAAPSTPRARVPAPIVAPKTPEALNPPASVSVSAAASTAFDVNTFVPVLLSAFWISAVVNVGLLVLCKSKPTVWFAATSFVLNFVSSIMFKQYCTHAGSSAQSKFNAPNWSVLVHSIMTVGTLFYLHQQGHNLWLVGSELHAELLHIGLGFALQEVCVFGSQFSIFRLARSVIEATLFSAASLCKCPTLSQLNVYLCYVLLALRVADGFTASAQICSHKKSAKFMYVLGVVSLLASLFYFVASVGPAPSVFDTNKTSVFCSLFALLFLYVAPKETNVFN
jgi:uncharacterized membrane protein